MKVIFIKSHYIKGRKQVVGQKANVWDDLGNDLINQRVAELYSGNMKVKTKTNFFKPK